MIAILLFLNSLAMATPPADGSYVRSCYSVGEDDVLVSQIQIQESRWTTTHTGYEDEACQHPWIIYEFSEKANLAGDNLDLDMIAASYTSLTDEVTQSLNETSYCGFSDWITGQKKEVTGLMCSDFQVPKVDAVTYSIFKFKFDTHQLFVGTVSADADGKTAQSRLKKFEPSAYILK
jgi:hypothetical protein